MNIADELKKNQVIITILPNNGYSKHLLKMVKYASKKYKTSVYVSLNKIYNALRKSFLSHKINPNKFFYIDGITKRIIPNVENVENCVFIDSSASLTQLSLTLISILEEKDIDLIIFDSLSTLLINNDLDKVERFTQFIVNKIRDTNTKAIFTVLEGDTEKGLIKRLGMFVDKIVKE